MGKRVDFSGRTVIGPDATLKMDQLGVPKEMAKILTISEYVNKYNINKLNNLIEEGKVTQVTNKDNFQIAVDYRINIRGTKLHYNDVIIRSDRDGNKQKFTIHNDNYYILTKEEKTIIKDQNFKLLPGDQIIRDGKRLKNIRYPKKGVYKLSIGDKVERQLQDNDIVLLNRQPTLHMGSMMSFRAKIMNYKTLRFNLCNTKSYNADFKSESNRRL